MNQEQKHHRTCPEDSCSWDCFECWADFLDPGAIEQMAIYALVDARPGDEGIALYIEEDEECVEVLFGNGEVQDFR